MVDLKVKIIVDLEKTKELFKIIPNLVKALKQIPIKDQIIDAILTLYDDHRYGIWLISATNKKLFMLNLDECRIVSYG